MTSETFLMAVLVKMLTSLDIHGFLRVGGSITEEGLSEAENNPIIVPGQHLIANLMMKYCIEHLHRGLLDTEDAICLVGCWGAICKRRVTNDIIRYRLIG